MNEFYDEIRRNIFVPMLMRRVFAKGPGDRASIPISGHTKTQKMVLDATLLNTLHYKVRIKGKVEQSRERSSTLPYTLCVRFYLRLRFVPLTQKLNS